MTFRFLGRWRVVAAIVAVVGPAQAAAQLPVPPADTTLASITSRGKLLVRYDIAAWHGTDAVMALHPNPADLQVSIAREIAPGHWDVLFGRLDAARDTFWVTYRAVSIDADSGYRAVHNATPVPYTGVEREMAAALDVAHRDLGPTPRPYNSYVIPATPAGYWVYFMPAQLTASEFPFGGDRRYHVIAGALIDQRVQLHRAILNQAVPAATGGSRVAAMTHTSVDSLPTATDVFLVLRRTPCVPEIVVTRSFFFQVDTTGRITATPVPAAKPSIPVWHATIDTVGTAPRITSPGYTLWRDTTTGWTIHLDQTIDLDAEPNSFDLGRRAVLLDDGRVLVSQRQPARISLYGTDGKLVRTIGEEGSNPDNFRGEIGIAAWHDTVIVDDAVEARALLFTTGGAFIRAFPTDIHTTEVAVDSRGLLRLTERIGLTGPVRFRWVYFTLRGARVDSVEAPTLPSMKAWQLTQGSRNVSLQIPFSTTGGTIVTDDRRVISGVTDSFAFRVSRGARDTMLMFGRSDVHPVPVDSAQFNSAIRSVVAQFPGVDSMVRYGDRPTTAPVWQSMAVDPFGYFWVVATPSTIGGSYLAIFSRDGYYLGPVRGLLPSLLGVSWNGDRVAWMGFDGAHRPVVRIYRIDRRGMH